MFADANQLHRRIVTAALRQRGRKHRRLAGPRHLQCDRLMDGLIAVPYSHLTLPTNRDGCDRGVPGDVKKNK